MAAPAAKEQDTFAAELQQGGNGELELKCLFVCCPVRGDKTQLLSANASRRSPHHSSRALVAYTKDSFDNKTAAALMK